MSYHTLLPLLKKTGTTLSPEQFHQRINIVFHDFEATNYDEMHSDMKESLQEQINLLVEDLFNSITITNQKLKLLDIGCGTGLSTQILLNSKLGGFIEEITLLDTSLNMLQYAEKKALNWNKKYFLKNSDVNSLHEKYDVILICSVLHHIPNLEQFLSKIDTLLHSNGILIHLQDPNGDFLNDEKYLNRLEKINQEKAASNSKKSILGYIPKSWKHFIKRKLGIKNYIDLVNEQLLAEKTISRRMSADELWSVTDIHVETKNDSINKGISLIFLKNQLFNFKLINQRSYGFFGLLKSDLPENLKVIEDELIMQNECNGRNISCVWIKN